MHASSLFRRAALAVVIFVAACGSSKDDDRPAPPPSAIARYAASVPVTAVATLDASSSTTTSGGVLSYSWALTSAPPGSTATIVNPTAVQASLTPDVAGVYAFTLSVSDGLKTQVVPAALTATAYTPPTILSDRVEPVSGVVQLSLSVDQGTSVVTWTADGTAIATGATVSWDTTTVADGSHAVVAQIQSTSAYTLFVRRSIQVAQSPVRITSAAVTQSANLFTAIVGAQSVNGIQRVDATLDGAPLGTLAAPNACVDATGAACASAGPNGYGFSGSVATGQHVVVVTATDGIGRQLGTQLRLTVP